MLTNSGSREIADRVINSLIVVSIITRIRLFITFPRTAIPNTVHTVPRKERSYQLSHFISSQLIGPIPWGHSGPLCHVLSLSLSLSSLSSSSWTSMRRRLIKTTASIITKFCRVIETPKYSLLVVQICPKQIQDGGRPPS